MRVLVIGAGIGGMSAGIALHRAGVQVELVEIDPLWRVYGTGITITGPTLRAFKQLGVYEDVKSQGFVGEGIRVCDVAGAYLRELSTSMPPDAHIEGGGGILRPVLHQILSSTLLDAGVPVRLGASADRIEQDADVVDVAFSDGTIGQYDLVVGADGVYSRTRDQIFPDAPKPEYTGQSVWRILTDRPQDVDQRHYFLGGPVMVGITPVSDSQMYLFLVERTKQEFRAPKELYRALLSLLDGYGGLIASIREKVTPETEIVFRPLESFHLLAPWHVGRVLLIGDAAHPTTPQLSSGAGIAVEDAIVLAEELVSHRSVPEALAAFRLRREARCRLVVESSIRIGELEQEGAPPEERNAILNYALSRLTERI